MVNRVSLALSTLMLLVALALVGYVAMTPRIEPTTVHAGDPSMTIQQQQASTDPTAGISVSGEGRVQVKPDIATANIGVDITAATLADASSQANTKVTAIIAKVKSLGVADNDIQTINYNVNPITNQPKENTTPTITGYHVGNQLRFTIRKIDDLGKILDAAVSAGANSIYGVQFTVADPKPYQDQARAVAIKDAQDKASQLAKNAGLQLGKIISLSEGMVTPVPMRAAASYAMDAGAVPVQTGEMDIVVDVSARFAIQ